MNKVLLPLLLVALLAICNLASAQINLKIESIPGVPNKWGVFVRTCDDVTPSGSTITGSGQVTFKFPSNLSVSSFTNHAGTWGQNATVSNPNEAVGFKYVSVGFIADSPQIIYQPDTETLLFSFILEGNTTGIPELIHNGVDPFDQLPNSVNSNPGNELTVLDLGVQPLGYYIYAGNYTGNTTNCTPSPQDTTVVNPPMDTTGNGGDTTIIDTTGNGGDTTIIDTTGNGGDTTIINPPGDTTQQTSGVDNLEKQRVYFTLYPSPTFFDWVTVRFLDSNVIGGTVHLYTLKGIPMGKLKKGQGPELTLNIGELPAGLYIITYEKDGKTLQRDKFLKQ